MLALILTKRGSEMDKPEDADWYDWDAFVAWADKQGISLEDEEDFLPWWDCWKAGYSVAMNTP